MNTVELEQDRVKLERLHLLCALPMVDFIPFNNTWLEPEYSSPLHFRRYYRLFWLKQAVVVGGVK